MKSTIKTVKISLLAVFCIVSATVKVASQNVAINDDGANPNSNAILDVDVSTNNKGVMIPRLTKAQKNAMALGATDIGLMIFQTDQDTGFWYWKGTKWVTFLSDTNRTRLKKQTLDFVGKGTGAAKTSTITFDNIIVEQYSIGNELFFATPLPIDYAGGDIIIGANFIPMGSETGKTVRWNCIYKAHAEFEALSGTTGTVDSGDLALTPSQYIEQDATFTVPAADISGKEALHFKIKRVAIGTGSNPATNPAVVHVYMQYVSNR